MRVQGELASESRAAFGARERLDAGVYLQMELQQRGVLDLASADVAHERTFIGVRLLVVIPRAGLRESLAARSALVRTLAGVRVHVNSHRSEIFRLKAAYRTYVGLVCVVLHVLPVSHDRLECAVADGAYQT